MAKHTMKTWLEKLKAAAEQAVANGATDAEVQPVRDVIEEMETGHAAADKDDAD